MSLYVFINPSARAGCDTKFIFKRRFEFRVFLLLDRLPYQNLRAQNVLLIAHRWRENNWMHTFPKTISVM